MKQHSIEYVERHYRQFLPASQPVMTPKLFFWGTLGSLTFGVVSACLMGIAA